MSEFRFFVFTCRDPQVDFRLALVDALRHDSEVWMIRLKRLPLVAGPNGEGDPRPMSFFRLLAFLREHNDGKIPVYFNSTNTIYPYVTALLRLVSPRGVWCLDMHDDLLYPHEGKRRIRRLLAIWIMCRFSDLVVVAAPNLRELFPRAEHLGNAGAIGVIPREGVDPKNVLIIASIDRRFDFGLLGRIARLCPQLVFHIHGQVGGSVRAQLDALLAAHSNVRYHGAYVMADLPGILARYAVSFAPYLQGVRQTRYVDPLRFYHCLNSGMEVITTDIPAAHLHERALHIIHDERDFAALFAASGALKQLKQPNHEAITWRRRADRLVGLVRGLPHRHRTSGAVLDH